MKIPLAIFAIGFSLLACSCGGDDVATSEEKTSAKSSGPTTDPSDPHFPTVKFTGPDERPKIDPPNLPPPRRLLVRNLEVGTGPVARDGDELGIWYFAVEYKTGKKTYNVWHPKRPYDFQLGVSGLGEGFEDGVVGMRVGGRRELVVPKHLMFGIGSTAYVVELGWVKPASQAPAGG
jgi:peptidylprolyl isomerase